VRIDVRRLVTMALKQPAIQQNILPCTLKMVRRSGDGLIRTPEMQTNSHALSSVSGRALATIPLSPTPVQIPKPQ
jgi:hypothetical protein